jgi:two-component system, sensor histidine kinase
MAVSGTDGSQNSEIATAMLRASIQSRCQQAGMAFAAMILNTAFCALLLGRGVNSGALALLLLASTGLLLIRYIIAVRALRTVRTASAAELKRTDRHFRWVSFASQMVTGALIWIVWGTRDEVSAYMLTLLICLYASGTMVNLAHDYRSFRLTIPLLMVQPVVFWLLRGVDGIAIAVILVGLTLLMVSSVRNSQRVFEGSIRIRFEKDDLLRQLEREKQTVLGALEQAESANRSKAFFMAAASHDLRQPLYAAKILADTMALQALPSDVKELLSHQTRALAAAGGLFDKLLDLSRFESGAITPTLREVHLKEVLNQIKSEFSVLCRTRGLALEIEGTEYVVRSDYDLLVRMLRNLMSNSVYFTGSGSVRVGCSAIDADVLLTIADTGIGIAPEDQERIFKEYVQIRGHDGARDHGVGLGLAIVRHIALLLDHRITLESACGSGTRMSIRLPRVHALAELS